MIQIKMYQIGLKETKELYDVFSRFERFNVMNYVDKKLMQEELAKIEKLDDVPGVRPLLDITQNAAKDPQISKTTHYTPQRTLCRLFTYTLGLIHDIYYENLPESERKIYLEVTQSQKSINLFRSDIESGLRTNWGPERTQRLFRSAFTTAMREEEAPKDTKTFAQALFTDVKRPDETLRDLEQEIKDVERTELMLAKNAISIAKQWTCEPQLIDQFIKKYFEDIPEIVEKD
ncbi:MAG: hypothetical protein NTW30_00945 [Candidatus Aenigmarchaeota archaeon]|nr:hypothetical protein [Candidatus Aenigmarchaeota archaeon]